MVDCNDTCSYSITGGSYLKIFIWEDILLELDSRPFSKSLEECIMNQPVRYQGICGVRVIG